MKAQESTIPKFMESAGTTFMIPVYQRNYDWKKSNCKQLFDDLLDVIKHNRRSHFFGSIVYINHPALPGEQEYVIIDGQQRITTLSLLMLALIHTKKETFPNDALNIEEVNDYLVGRYSKAGKLKLKPVKNDNEAIEAVVDKKYEKFENTNIVINYKYFKERLLETQQNSISLDKIFESVKKLVVVEIMRR